MQLKEVFGKYEGNKSFQARVGAKSQRNASFWQKIIMIIRNGDIEGQRSIHKLKHNFFSPSCLCNTEDIFKIHN